MGLFESLKRILTGSAPKPASNASATPRPVPEAIRAPEVEAAGLLGARRNGDAPLLLDCREPYERQQAHIPGSQHIVMREIPQRLGELDRAADIVVFCAHGNRSYSVAGYLIQNGFKARSLRGGITAWQASGGEVQRD